MDNTDARRQMLAGFFTIVGIVMIIAVVWIMGRDKGWTEPRVSLQVLYSSVGGLIEGAPIRLAGVTVGSVGEIEFLKQEILGRRVMARMNIYEKYRHLVNSTAKFYIISEGVLGEKLVEIKVDGPGEPIVSGRPMIGEDPMEIQELASAFAGAAKSFQKTAEDLNQDLSEIDIKELADILAETAQSLTHTAREIDQLIVDARATLKDSSEEVKPLLQELRETNRRTGKVIDRVEEKLIEGNLFKVF